MNALSLSSSLSISKPFHCLPLSNKEQRPSHMQFVVSCRATKLKSNESNLYNILSLSPKSATVDDIKRSYRSMALQYHPDVCHDPSMKEECTRMFVKLNAAYETLSNPMLRAQYDCELGLRSRMMSTVTVSDDEKWRSRWQEQVCGLKKRSRRRMGQKGGSWGNRMRAQNMKEGDHLQQGVGAAPLQHHPHHPSKERREEKQKSRRLNEGWRWCWREDG